MIHVTAAAEELQKPPTSTGILVGVFRAMAMELVLRRAQNDSTDPPADPNLAETLGKETAGLLKFMGGQLNLAKKDVDKTKCWQRFDKLCKARRALCADVNPCLAVVVCD